MTITAIIVDDEPFARDDICELLQEYNHIRVVGEAANIEEAKALLTLYEPDLVFLDIQLLGGNGFELIQFIPPSTDIIFVTAFEEFAVRAFEINALDYLLKPVSEERLAASLDRINHSDRSKAFPCEVTDNVKFNVGDRIFVKTDKEQRFILLSDIVAITSIGGNYTKLHLKDNNSVLSHRTFKRWEELLPDISFLRIHRLAIVNLNSIDRVSVDDSGSHQVHLRGYGQTLVASRRLLPRLKARLEETFLN